jgi:hypothetical protein
MSTLLSGLLVLFALTATVAAQDAQRLYQRGLVEEHAKGNLKEAIALYEQVARAAGPDRALAARAMIRAAGSREKLGQRSEAAHQYAEVIRAYPEQRAEAAAAQARLSALRAEEAAHGPRTTGRHSTDVSLSTTPLFERYCVQCHRAGNRAGGLDVTALNDRSIAENTTAWEQILARLQARRDPPAGAPRPDEATYRSVVSTLQSALDGAYASNPTLHGAERATDAELAARLAAFLWNAPPDAPLLDDAQHGRLRNEETLRRQVARMLRDPRSSGLVNGFFTNWLSLDRIRDVRPDPSRYPQFDGELLQAMQTETRLFIDSQVREDHDAIELWNADYTFVNERLARHYGLAGVTGAEFRRVTWPNSDRAGILGQAGPLAALSVGGRTSPTTRGRFILSRFLGIDAPDPPANVPPLAEHPPTPGTMRERLQAHKLIPSCASCHAMFDPLGLALENFDAIGAWRTTDGGAPIDASGTFIDGTRFDGPAALRAGLLKYRDAYYTNVTARLLAYALHRTDKSVRVYDYEMPAVRRIVRDASRDHFRWSSIIAGIAASSPFQMKHIVP